MAIAMESNVAEETINPSAEATPETPALDDLPIEGQQIDKGPSGEAGEEKPSQQAVQPPKQATTGEADAAPSWWKPDLFKLKYRGSEVSPKDYNHAVQLMQKGWSYEQAMTEVKAQKQEYEANKAKYSQYERLDDAFKKNPAFANRIQQMYLESQGGAQQQPQGQQGVQAQQQNFAPEVMQKLQEFDQFRAKWEESQADGAVQQEITDMRSKFPDEKWDVVTETGFTFMRDVLKHALDNRFPNLLAAYRDYTYDRVANNAKMQGAEQVAQQRQRQVRQGVIASGAPRPSAAKPSVDVSRMSYDDLTEIAKKEVGLT